MLDDHENRCMLGRMGTCLAARAAKIECKSASHFEYLVLSVFPSRRGAPFRFELAGKRYSKRGRGATDYSSSAQDTLRIPLGPEREGCNPVTGVCSWTRMTKMNLLGRPDTLKIFARPAVRR